MIVQRFGGCLPSEGLAGPGVEGRGDGVEVILAVSAEVGAFRCLCVCQAAGLVVVESWLAGLGSDLSEELVVGVEPAALDCRAAPRCPPRLAACRRSSVIMTRQRWSARRLFSSLSQVEAIGGSSAFDGVPVLGAVKVVQPWGAPS